MSKKEYIVIAVIIFLIGSTASLYKTIILEWNLGYAHVFVLGLLLIFILVLNRDL